MANRKRKNAIYLHVNDEELQLMERKMELAGIKTISAYIRQQVRYGFVYEADYAPLREFNAQLGKIGSNVNQIAKRVNETHRIYKEDMEELKEMMEKIWHIQKSILSQQPFIKR